MTQIDFLSLIEPIARLVRQAGHLILQQRGKTLQIEQKGAANYVTQIDFAVQTFVLDRLRELTPGFAVIAEESDVNQYGSDRPTWILDPVDGTTNLMHDYRQSAVSLALAEQDTLLLGFIYNPYTDELFEAALHKGARLKGQAIRCSDRRALADCLIGFGTTPYDRREAHSTFVLLEQVFLKSLEIRRSGSAALDLASIACGRLDGFFEYRLQPWDYAAGGLILQEAGGRISNWQNSSPSLCRGDSVLATNGLIHAALLDLMQNNLPDHTHTREGS